MIPRTVIYNILLSKVPPQNLHKPMRMLSMTQGENGVHIRFANGSDFEGDILVGADGAYSAVRQNLYEKLKREKTLPASDAKDLPFSCVCLAGHSGPLDPEKFTELKDPECHFYNTIGTDKPYSVRFQSQVKLAEPKISINDFDAQTKRRLTDPLPAPFPSVPLLQKVGILHNPKQCRLLERILVPRQGIV